MSKQSKKIKAEIVNFQLKGIELLDLSILHPKNGVADFKIFHFEIKIEHNLTAEHRFFVAIIYIDLFNEQRDLKLGSITLSCTFEIENISDFVDTKSKCISLPDDFLITINAITISTARGIMFSQFKGTFLHHAFLPIIDPSSFTHRK